MITPEKLAANGSEHGHQAAFFAWCAVAKVQGATVADMWAKGMLNGRNFIATVSSPLPCLEWIHAIPNGGSRGGDAKSRAIAGGRLKAEGVKPGIADIFLPWPKGVFHGLYIELKKPDLKPVRAGSLGGRSLEQIDFADWCRKSGYGHATCYGWQEAVEVLKSYLSLN
jgi:hypothetical protein